MNYLAHIYLSGETDADLKIGNFIADTVVGNHYEHYSLSIKRGIFLHRAIDTYTDAHRLFRQSKKRLVPDFGHYAGVIVDMFYDYFLAKYWENYMPISLADYVSSFYQLLETKKQELDTPAQRLAYYIVRDNWLASYASIEGLGKILYQMDSRTDFRSRMQYAIVSLSENEEEYKQEFEEFFVEMQAFVKTQIEKIYLDM